MQPTAWPSVPTSGPQIKPPPAFEAMVNMARNTLTAARWASLARVLGLPPLPGLVTV